MNWGRVGKFFDTARRDGLSFAIGKTMSRLLVDYPIQQRRIQLGRKIDRLLSSTVGYGPFKGLRFAPGSWWGIDRAAMLLGLYEREVLDSLLSLPKTHRTFVDVGAADGYYAVGTLAGGLFERSYCFEESARGRSVIAENAALNGVAGRIEIYGAAAKDFYKHLPAGILSNAVLLVDIEGGEFDIFDRDVFAALSGSVIFVEIHDRMVLDGAAKLQKFRDEAQEHFRISEMTTTSRDLSGFPELRGFTDTDRWLICSEGRPEMLTLYRLDPKVQALAGEEPSARHRATA